jgi:hypothetical protein
VKESTGPSADSESFASRNNMIIGGDNANTDSNVNVNNISRLTHESLLNAKTNHPDEDAEDYEKDEAIQCVYSSFGQTVGELFEFCLMGEVIPQKKKKVVPPKKRSDGNKARRTPCRENKETETYNGPSYSDSQRKAVEEMFGPASSGSHTEKEETSSIDSSGGVGGGRIDDFTPHRVPSLNASHQQTFKAILAPGLSISSSSSDKEEESASGGLEYDYAPRKVPLTPRSSLSEEWHASTEERAGVIDVPVLSTDISAPEPQWKAKEPVASGISMTPFGDASPNIRTRRQRSRIAKQMQRRKYGQESRLPHDCPPESHREEQHYPAYDPPSEEASSVKREQSSTSSQQLSI